MTTGFDQNGSDLFDSEFEPWTSPFTKAGATNYTINNVDLNQRYLAVSALAGFHGGSTNSNVNFQANGTDLKGIFVKKGTVTYGITIHITSSQLNLNLRTFVNTYLQNNYPANYDANYTYFSNNYNANAGFSATNPSITVVINSGVVVYSNSTSYFAMDTGTFPAGVFIKVINQGYIVGMGGVGGTDSSQSPATNGENGATAINCSQNVTIDNSAGYIYGGGGGGGGGGPAVCQGHTVDSGNYTIYFAGGDGGHGADAYNGTVTNNTSGQQGILMGGRDFPCNTNGVNGLYSGHGGDGGTWGAAGNNGYTDSTSTNYLPNGNGGNAGYALVSNGHTVTWQGGNTSPHLLGPTS